MLIGGPGIPVDCNNKTARKAPMPRRTSIAATIAAPLTAMLALLPHGAHSQDSAKAYPGAQGGEITLPMGDISFADRVVSYTEGSPSSSRDDARDPAGATGPLDYHFGKDAGRFVTLGCHGSIVLEFTDNALIDMPMADLHVWEIGPDAEPTRLEISKNGNDWIEVGKISGGTASIDIADYVTPGDSFRFVRLTDLECLGRSGRWPGADIAAVAAVGTAVRLQLDSSVLFDFDKAELKPSASAALKALMVELEEYTFSSLAVVGHTDSQGSEDYNLELSERRAHAVADYLTQHFPRDVVLNVSGHGESEPVESNDTEIGRAANRRVEIIVIP